MRAHVVCESENEHGRTSELTSTSSLTNDLLAIGLFVEILVRLLNLWASISHMKIAVYTERNEMFSALNYLVGVLHYQERSKANIYRPRFRSPMSAFRRECSDATRDRNLNNYTFE